MGSPKPKLQTLDFEQFNESEGNTLSKKERETLNELKTVVDSGEYSIAVDPMSQTYKLVNKKGNTYTEQTGLKVKGDLAQRVFGGDRKRTSALVGRMIEGNYMKKSEDETANLPGQSNDSTPASNKPPLPPVTVDSKPTKTTEEQAADDKATADAKLKADQETAVALKAAQDEATAQYKKEIDARAAQRKSDYLESEKKRADKGFNDLIYGGKPPVIKPTLAKPVVPITINPVVSTDSTTVPQTVKPKLQLATDTIPLMLQPPKTNLPKTEIVRPTTNTDNTWGYTDEDELGNSALVLGALGAGYAGVGAGSAVVFRRELAKGMDYDETLYGPWRTTLMGDKGVQKLMDKTKAEIAIATDADEIAGLQTKYDALKGQLAENRPFTKASVKKATEVIAEQTKKIDEVLDAKIAVATSSKPALATLDLKQIVDLEEQIADLRVAAKGTSTHMVADTPEIKALSDKLKLLKSTIKTSADRVDLLNLTGALQADKATAKLAAKPVFEAAEEVIKARKLAPITPKLINSVLRGNAKAGKPILQYISKII